MNNDWYVVDKRTKEIMNCISMSGTYGEVMESVRRSFTNAEHLEVTRNPTMAQLQQYRYWNERP